MLLLVIVQKKGEKQTKGDFGLETLESNILSSGTHPWQLRKYSEKRY